MVEITGNGRLAPSLDLALPPGKCIPDGKPLAIAVISPLVLCGRHRHPPLEIFSELLGYQPVQVCHCRIEYLSCVFASTHWMEGSLRNHVICRLAYLRVFILIASTAWPRDSFPSR